ncbi:Protein disulfide-isomerase [Diplonema papillatum]|nr:Protein disulfide-isomerase [Diplonema papillatum]
MRTTMLALMAIAAIAHAEVDEKDVVVGDAANFPELIKEGVVLAEFYAPWCGHCKKLTPEWAKAATQLKGKATLIKVDATLETDLGAKYAVQGYPTIKAFIDGGDAVDYEGGRTADDIVAWVEKMSGPAVKPIESADELKALKDGNKLIVTGFFKDAESDDAKAFSKFAKQHRMEYVFASVFDEKLAKADDVTVPSVVVFKNFDNLKDVLQGAFDEEKVVSFLKSASFAKFGEIGPDNYKDYVARDLPLGWLFVDPEDEAATEEAKKAVAAVAEKFGEQISFVWLSGVKYGQMAGNVGLSGKTWPSFGIDNKGEHFPFDEAKKLSSDDFKTWVEDYAAGKLVATVKSEPIPEKATVDGLTTLVGDNFKEIVMDKTKDVLIKFYAPWCGHCKKMIPAYDELAKTFEDNDSIIIAKIDATANDVPKEYGVEGFPTLKLVTKDNKVIAFDGAREAAPMEEFIRKNAVSLQ